MGDGAEPAEQGVPGSVDSPDGLFDDFDGVGDICLHFFDDLSPLVDPSPVGALAATGSMSPETMSELEKFLMEDAEDVLDGEQQTLSAGFFADMFFAGSEDGSVESAVSSGDGATPPESVTDEKSDEDVEPRADAAAGWVVHDAQTNGEDSETKDEENEETHGKKRRRQMKNRESAMKSRERKKMYVKDLEMKSKFMSLEVKRLQHALHCCATENMALRQSMTKARALSAPLAIQESAALFVESLLLGSLYWLVSIVCLFMAPWAPPEASGASRNQERGVGVEEVVGSDEESTGLEPLLIFEKRSCRALRTRMKERCSSLYHHSRLFLC